MAVSNNYQNFSELPTNFRSGYLIVRDVLFEVDKGTITGSWDLESITPSAKARESREVAELSNRKRIVYDDEHVYDPETLLDEGELLTNQEAYDRMSPEDKDDYDSFDEYWMNH